MIWIRLLHRLPSVVTYGLVVMALSLAVLWLIPANYYMVFPGQAQQVSTMISIPGHRAPKGGGALFDTYVNEFRATRLLYVLFGLVRSDVTVEPASAVSGGCPDSQYQQQLLAMMQDSKTEAEAAALSVLGNRVAYDPNYPEIIQVNSNVPAASTLRTGDRILAIDGRPITTRAAVQAGLGPSDPSPPVDFARKIILSRPPGSVLSMKVRRQAKVDQLSVRTIRANDCGNPVSHGGHTLVGISMQQPLKLPTKVDINSGTVGGPSAGMAFALGIVQQLSGRNLTNGNRVAATGTISLVQTLTRRGRPVYSEPVGPIGGARQKALAAQAAGAKYFLVPVENFDEARSAHAHLKVIPVATLRQALSVLAGLPRPNSRSGNG